MSLLDKIIGPKSKYYPSIPYTYEARMPMFAGSEEYNSYFADTICGLVEHLHQRNIKPEEVQIFEIFQDKETPIDPKRFTTADNQWMFRPDMCRAFEDHYEGHINEHGCSFEDRDRKGCGP